jgi:hypothetical protein
MLYIQWDQNKRLVIFHFDANIKYQPLKHLNVWGVGGCSIGYCESKHTTITRLLSISNPNMLWSCNLSHTSQVVFLWLIGMQWSFRASHPHTQKFIDIEIWLCKWASCLLLLVLCFVFFFFFGCEHWPTLHLIVRSVQILLGLCVVGTCSHENYFTLSVGVCVWEIFHLHRLYFILFFNLQNRVTSFLSESFFFNFIFLVSIS